MTGPSQEELRPATVDLGAQSTKSIIVRSIRPSGRRILDIGCGAGALVAWLHREDADAIGIDPDAELLRAAAARRPGFWIAGRAEHLPIADCSVDAALFFNSLHHVPEASLEAALVEARRALRPGGDLLIIEPLASGTYFELLRPLDDETAVRAAALAAIDAVPDELLEPIERARFDTSLDYASAAEITATFLRADPGRAALIEPALPAISERFAALGQQLADGGRRFDQPMLALLLRRPRR